MTNIKFTPLRRIKKTNKIAVTSYIQWRKIKSQDDSDFILIINSDYKRFNKSELVHNHRGENLFWRHINPDTIPLVTGYELSDGEMIYPKTWVTDYGFYSSQGLDCDGVPLFSHYTAEEIFKMGLDMTDFELLTVEVVRWWFGWFLYQLENIKLEFI